MRPLAASRTEETDNIPRSGIVTIKVTIPSMSVAPEDGIDHAATAVATLTMKMTTRKTLSAIFALRNAGNASIIRVPVSKANAAHSE